MVTIYNFRLLRAELETAGHLFATHTATDSGYCLLYVYAHVVTSA